ncbi:MAG: Rne/Rng family ribonuclease, partial [Proteobacteria bacterium]|nr:Rne/Rng family ribonuclease [Pseudomonadota bacterium]
MKNIYLNIKQPEESRIIVARDDTLIDFEQEFQGEENKRGNIYKGTVTNLEPSLEAVFVNFGEDKNGFLPMRQIPKNMPGVSPGGIAVGDKLLVQIKKDNIGDKGAGLTSFISLAGNFLVLLPYREESYGVSSNASADARKEMNHIMDELPVPESMSIIARSSAMNHTKEDIAWDLRSYLLPLWEAVQSAAEKINEPTLIYRENDLSLRVMRDYFRPDNQDVIICDSREKYEELNTFVKMLFPDNSEQVRFHDSIDNMVPPAIENKIEEIYMREVATPSGVRVVFDSTEALVAIDVNSGRQRKGGGIEETAFKTNLEAAEIITEQLRLRNLGGLVVVDFIDMRNRENREALEKRVTELVRKDRARIRISKISEFGLLEMSRQRKSRSLIFSQTQLCPRCSGSGLIWREQSFALYLLRKISTVAFQANTQTITLQVPREIGVFLLNEKRDDLRQIESYSGCSIVVVPDNHLESPQYKLKPTRGTKADAIKAISQQTKKEEIERYKYEPQEKVTANSPLIKDMLPQEAMPSKKNSFSFAGFLKNIFGGKSVSSANDSNGANRNSSRSEGRASGRRGENNSRGRGGRTQQSPRQGRRDSPGRGAKNSQGGNSGRNKPTAATNRDAENQHSATVAVATAKPVTERAPAEKKSSANGNRGRNKPAVDTTTAISDNANTAYTSGEQSDSAKNKPPRTRANRGERSERGERVAKGENTQRTEKAAAVTEKTETKQVTSAPVIPTATAALAPTPTPAPTPVERKSETNAVSLPPIVPKEVATPSSPTTPTSTPVES